MPSPALELRAKDLKLADAHLVASDLDWVILRPGTLTDKPGTGRIPAAAGIPYGEVSRDDIGLSTITYLIKGEVEHRDSERYVQTVRPGEVNLMTAGRGIVHSERSGEASRARSETMFGFQAWLGLPLHLEETDPGFQHVAAGDVPMIADQGVEVRLLAGSLGGRRSPTEVFSETLYADVVLADGARFPIESRHVERAVYVVDGAIEVGGQTGRFGTDQLVVFRPDADVVLRAVGMNRLMLLGGEPLEGPRHIYWNFVSSRKERIDQAAEDWRARRFPGVPGDDVEFIPLPGAPRRPA